MTGGVERAKWSGAKLPSEEKLKKFQDHVTMRTMGNVNAAPVKLAWASPNESPPKKRTEGTMGVQERGGASRDGLGHRLGRSCLLTQLPGDAGYLGSRQEGKTPIICGGDWEVIFATRSVS